MRHLSPFLSPLLLSAGAGLAAWGGYGAGLGRAAGAGLGHWLEVAAAVAAGLGLFGAGLWRNRRGSGEPPGSLAADLAALEPLVPALRSHPGGLPALQSLIDVLFEARHRPDAPRRVATLAEKEGHSHA